MQSSKLTKVMVGESSPVRKHVITAEDVLQFAAISGDYEKIHVDESYAKTTPYKRRIVHGILLLGQMGTGLLDEERTGLNVSYGYDRVRFIRPIFVGDTITTVSRVIEKREDRNEVLVEEKLFDAEGQLAVIAHHLYKFI
jgi:3-hydroxybutyryl-CoA dehydratase